MKVIFTIILTTLLNISLFGQALTIGEIYDYQPGDEFLIRRKAPGPPSYRYHKILKRTDFGADSVQYQFSTAFITLNMQFFAWFRKDSSYSITYTNLTKPYFEKFLKNDTIAYDTIGHDSSVFYFIYLQRKDTLFYDSCGTLTNQRYYFSGAPLSEQYITTTKTMKGIPILIDFSYGMGNYYTDNLIYYKKGNIICGNKEELPINIASVKYNHLKLYPNPVNDYIHTNGYSNYTFSIFNSVGLILHEGSNQDNADINVSDLKPGLYILSIASKEGNMSATFIKN